MQGIPTASSRSCTRSRSSAPTSKGSDAGCNLGVYDLLPNNHAVKGACPHVGEAVVATVQMPQASTLPVLDQAISTGRQDVKARFASAACSRSITKSVYHIFLASFRNVAVPEAIGRRSSEPLWAGI